MSEITSIPPSVAAGLVKARRAVQAVSKSATNAHMKYKYASADAIMAEALSALSEGGLTFSTLAWSVCTVERSRTIATESGETHTLADVGLRLRCTHVLAAEDGACVMITTDDAIIPDRGRPEDKATYGALTESYAYALRGLLGIPRVDESISVSGRDDSAEPRRAPPAARPLAPPAANDAPPAGEVSHEGNLARRLRQARTPAEVQSALGACKADLAAGSIDREAMARLFSLYQSRNAELTAGAAQ